MLPFFIDFIVGYSSTQYFSGYVPVPVIFGVQGSLQRKPQIP
jgi:hypothetical protein